MTTVETSNEQSEKMDQVSLDIIKLAETVRGEIKVLRPLSDDCCIYRVPSSLREVRHKAYTPRVVSIGPLHHGKEGLEEMEEHKTRYLQDFLHLSKVSMEDLIHLIAKNETRLRNYYAEAINLSSEKFVKMMLLDAVFIVMLFLKYHLSPSDMENSFSEMQPSVDRVYDKPWMINDIKYDIILLENQLPFFILQDCLLLEASQIPARLPGLSMIELTAEFMEGFVADWYVKENISAEKNSSEIKHLVDFLRICLLPSKLSSKTKLKTINTPTVTELQNAGVKFKLSTSKSWLDIKFEKGILEIPLIQIGDDTELILRNIQAFERCHCDENDYLCDFIAMIKRLVNAPKDVGILVEHGIIENWLWGNEGVSILFHNLSLENLVSSDDFYYSDLIEELNAYCRITSHKWKATLKKDYFGTPWAAISVIAASILLILTVVQTVCSIIQL